MYTNIYKYIQNIYKKYQAAAGPATALYFALILYILLHIVIDFDIFVLIHSHQMYVRDDNVWHAHHQCAVIVGV